MNTLYSGGRVCVYMRVHQERESIAAIIIRFIPLLESVYQTNTALNKKIINYIKERAGVAKKEEEEKKKNANQV